MEPPEMAVFSFIDLPDVLTNKKGERIMKKDNTLKQSKVRSENIYQSDIPEEKKQKWILINKQGHLSGILDHIDYNTRKSAKDWFQRTSSLSGQSIRIEDFFYVLKVEEYEFLKELNVLDILDDQNVN